METCFSTLFNHNTSKKTIFVSAYQHKRSKNNNTMPRRTYSNSYPARYAVCIHDNCPIAKDCLRWQTYQKMLQKEERMNIVNPIRCEPGKQCEFFREDKPVIYARGFTGIQRMMLPHQYNLFSFEMILHFGRSSYYERRRGNIALYPPEQKMIIEAIRATGFEGEIKFDKYEESRAW